MQYFAVGVVPPMKASNVSQLRVFTSNPTGLALLDSYMCLLSWPGLEARKFIVFENLCSDVQCHAAHLLLKGPSRRVWLILCRSSSVVPRRPFPPEGPESAYLASPHDELDDPHGRSLRRYAMISREDESVQVELSLPSMVAYRS